jgi:hypothetical protein
VWRMKSAETWGSTTAVNRETGREHASVGIVRESRRPGGPLHSTLRVARLFCLTALGAACGAGAIRPRFKPFPEAVADTVEISADSAVSQIGELLVIEGIEIRHLRPAEGYVDTKWFDVATSRSASLMRLDADSVVRLRFWTDPTTVNECLVVGEAVTRRIFDPSLPERETEEPVPPEHPAAQIVRRIIGYLKERNTG